LTRSSHPVIRTDIQTTGKYMKNTISRTNNWWCWQNSMGRFVYR